MGRLDDGTEKAKVGIKALRSGNQETAGIDFPSDDGRAGEHDQL